MMEFDKKFKQFPLWGRVIVWSVVFGLAGVLTWYAVSRAPEVFASISSAITELLP